MSVEDLIFVSVDDHVLEPPNTFAGRLPTKFADRGPKFVADDNGRGTWIIDGAVKSPWTMNYSRMRPGTHDPHERVKELSSVGVLGSLCFPSFPRFAGQLFLSLEDKELALACVRAYNDWMVEDWAGAQPDRLIPLAIMPLWDPTAMADEVRRVARRGVHTIVFSENISKLGQPSIFDKEHWAPFWKALSDEGSNIATHIGSSSSLPQTSPDQPIPATGVMIQLNLYGTAADFVWSHVFKEYDFKLLLAEGGTGWVPFFLERCESNYRTRPWIREQFGPKSPTEVFREHIITCFIEDQPGIEMRHMIGIDNICWEFDYPHGDCLWPDGIQLAWDNYLSRMPKDEVDKITHLNAINTLRWDPFSIRPREQCTVGALLKEASAPWQGAVNGGFWDSALGEKEAAWRESISGASA